MNKLNFKKIRIVGGSGSGKSYLGKKLSSLTNIPFVSIDELVYDFSKTHCFDYKRSDDYVKKMLNKHTSKNAWIVEGGYYKLTKHTYDEADIIIFLKPVFVKRFFNTLKRFFKRLFDGKYEGLFNFFRLTIYNFRTMNKWNKERTKLFNELYKNKVYYFDSADFAFDWFIGKP